MLIEKYKHHIFKVTFSVAKDVQEAEDLTQETFLKIIDALPSYQSQGFKTWISRIAHNTAIDSFRKKKRRQEDLTSFDEPILHIQQEQSAENEMLSRNQKIRVQDAIHSMPANYRDVVYDYYIREKSYAEIAKKLDMAEKTVEMRLYRARKWMKQYWKEDDFS
ncbi:sigma-70 family RNA polymerase sigma factor [Salinibacillus xinjiangensis]|uniref:RNA polymerase sigma factor n=2 Tax=Salinibacillus xinjiangensis TaxID=1229268 RepID=A0A6G1X923_9BACI|nr:sigma-70 family RNA polymerase sigma factor [Salinibacillus xinjiangensis]